MARTVVVSGGSRGLGQSLTRAFLTDGGFKVATFSRSSSPFTDEVSKEQKFAGRFYFEQVDLSDREGVKAFIGRVRERFGSIDILVNNAGIALEGVLALQSDEDVDRMVDTNLKGVVALTRRCVREMLQHRWGRIVTVTSIVGKSGYRGLSVYSTTKAGLDGFTRSLARELGDRGITANSVAPGFLDTDMTHGLTAQQREQIVGRTPAGRLGNSEDVVPIVMFLCSDEAGFITGQTIVVDGGLTA